MDNNDPNRPGSPPYSQMGTGQPPAETQPLYAPQTYPQADQPASDDPTSYTQPPTYMSQPVSMTPDVQPAIPPKKRGGPGLIIGVVTLIVLIAAGAVGLTFFNKLANRPAVSVAKLLPANTLAYLTVDTNVSGKQKGALDKMKAAFESQPGFKEAWSKITKEAMDSTGQSSGDASSGLSDFDSLAQYLGNNVTIAVFPPSTADLETLKNSMGDTTSGAMDVMMRNVAGILDLDFNPLNKKGPISELKKQVDNFANAPLAEKYRDTEIRKYVTNTTTIYFSLLNGTSTVVVGGNVEPVHVMIDQFKDNKGLSEAAQFRTLSGQVPSDNIASAYVNLTEIYKDIELAQPDMFKNGATKADGAALITLSAQDDGMQLDVASEVDLDGTSVKVNPGAHPDASTLSDIPSGSLGFLAGTDLKNTVQSTLDMLRKQSKVSGGEDMVQSTLDDMEKSTGLSLEKDVLPWMGGDYVLSATADGKDGEAVPSVVFQLKLSAADHDKAAAALDKLVKSTSNGAEQKLEVPEGTFYAPSPEMGVVLGTTKDRLLIIYNIYNADVVASATAMIKTVLGDLGKGLGSTPQWKDVSKHLPNNSNAIMYLDITGIRTIAERVMPSDGKQEYEQSAAPFVRPFKYLALGSAASPGSEGSLTRSHSILFLGISK